MKTIAQFSRRIPWVILWGMCVLFWSWGTRAPAQTSKPITRNEIHREDVLEDRLEERLNEEQFRGQAWIPMERDEFERLLAKLLPKPPGPTQSTLRQVRYTATIVGDTISDGHLQLVLQDVPQSSPFVSLGEPTLAIDELTWTTGPAVWGTAPDGRHWLKRHPTEHTLEGLWTARGRVLLTGVVFDLKLLPAAVTQLELTTPAGHQLASDVGDVVRLESSVEASPWRWRIDLGNQSRCRLIVSAPTKPEKTAAPTVLYEQQLAVDVSSEELELHQLLQAEVLAGSVDRFTVSFPRQCEISTVTYGDQLPLKFERIPSEGPAAQMVVWFPEPVQGLLRPIRLEGFLRNVELDSLVIPQFQWEGGLWLHGRVDISISKPWELRSSRATGYRQSSPINLRSESERETLSFQQYDPRAQLILNIDRPPVERTAHVLNQLTTTEASWMLTAEIAWESRSGTVFDAACRLPDGWQIISVVQLGGDRKLQELAGWEVQPHPESGQLLKMDFSEGLTPGRVDPVRIVAHHNALAAPLTHFPVVVPVDCESMEIVLLADAQATGSLPLGAATGWEPFDFDAAAAVWNTLPSWSVLQSGTPEARRLFHLTSSETAIPIPPEEAIKVLDATVQVSVKIENHQVDERFQIDLQVADTQREIELYAPRGAGGIVWTIVGHSDAPTMVKRNSPATVSGDGETWGLVLPQPVTGSIQLIGQRSTLRESEYVVPLLFFPQARRFQGRVVLTADPTESYQLRELSFPGSETVVPPAGLPEELSIFPREWSYRTRDREWVVQTHRPVASSGHPTSIHLTSVLAVDATRDDYHQLHVSAEALKAKEEFHFHLDSPAQLISVLQSGRPLPTKNKQGEITVTGWESSWDGEVAILYRVPATARLCGLTHQLVLPRLSLPYGEWGWHVCLPPETSLSDEALGIHFSPRPDRTGWFQRLLGPLSRMGEESLFPAWTSESITSQASRSETLPPKLDPQSLAAHGVILPTDLIVLQARSFGLPEIRSFVVWDRNALWQATWAAFLGAVPVGFWMRRCRGAWQNRLLAVLICISTCLTVFGPEGWNLVFGGGSSGLLLACFLPQGFYRRWLTASRERLDRSQNTQVFQKAAWPIVLLVGFCTGIPFLTAQESSPTTVPVASSSKTPVPAPKYQVLVPVDQEKRPSRKLPVVYVSPALHELLLALEPTDAKDPGQLIESAEYLVYTDAQRRPSLKIKYTISVIPAKERTELIVPLSRRWASGLESCTVDGQPQAAISSPEGAMLIVPMTPTTIEESSEGTVRHEVDLQIHLPATLDLVEGTFQADVLPVLNSRFTWKSPASLHWFEIPQARGEVKVSLDRRLVEAALGAVDAWEMKRGTEDRSSRDEATSEVTMMQLLTLHPMFTQASFRADCRVLSGDLYRVELELPEGARLRDIRSHKMLQWTVRSQEGAASVVVIDFQEPWHQNFVVEGEYILPRAATDQNFGFPRCRVRCGKPASPQRDLVAITCEAGFSVQMVNLDDPAVLPILAGEFVSQWGDTVPNQLPRLAYKIQEGGNPTFRLAAIQSEQQVVRFKEDVTVSNRRLDWLLTADLKSTAPSAYFYSLLVDHRLSIDEISLRENGIDQLLRYSKTRLIGSDQNRLTLFLKNEAIGVCQLQIRGSLRMSPSTFVKLPSVRFETPQNVPGTLSLFHEAGTRLELEGRQIPLDGEGTFPDLLTEPASAQFFKRLKISEGDSHLSVRVEPAVGTCQVRSLWFVSPELPGGSIRGRMELTPQAGTREVRLAIPEWLSAARLITPGDASLPMESEDDPQRKLLIRFDGNPQTVRVLEWDADLKVPEDTMWQFSLPKVIQDLPGENYLAISSDTGWVSDPYPSVPVSTLSEAFVDQMKKWGGENIELLTQSSSEKVTLHRVDEQSPDGKSSVILVEHRLLGLANGDWQGESVFHPSLSAGTVEIQLPRELEILGFRWDGRTELVDQAGELEHRWRVKNAGHYRSLEVRWRTSKGTRGKPWTQRPLIPLPRCVQAQAPIVLSTLTPANDAWWTIWSEHLQGDRWENALTRLEWLVRRHQREVDAGTVDLEFSREIWNEYRAAAAAFSDQNFEQHQTEQNLQRWKTITGLVGRIEDPGNQQLVSSLGTAPMSLPADDRQSSFGTLPSEVTELHGWMIRRGIVNGVLEAIVLVVGWWLMPFVIGLQCHPWLIERPHRAWLLFGFVWWIFLSPSIVGFAIMAWSVFDGVWQRRPRVVINR